MRSDKVFDQSIETTRRRQKQGCYLVWLTERKAIKVRMSLALKAHH
jgi:hypothetical protein